MKLVPLHPDVIVHTKKIIIMYFFGACIECIMLTENHRALMATVLPDCAPANGSPDRNWTT